jgi:hypothetical protein
MKGKGKASTGSARTQTPESAHTASRIKLTGETITDAVIRELLFDARRLGDVAMAVRCSKALVHIMPGSTVVAVLQRREARRACAAAINHRIDRWVRLGTKSGYAKYARMLEVAEHHESPTGGPAEPRPRKGRKPKLKLKCCWYCNDRFEFGNYKTVQTKMGAVTVHRDCVSFLVSEGIMDAPDVTTVDLSPDDE